MRSWNNFIIKTKVTLSFDNINISLDSHALLLSITFFLIAFQITELFICCTIVHVSLNVFHQQSSLSSFREEEEEDLKREINSQDSRIVGSATFIRNYHEQVFTTIPRSTWCNTIIIVEAMVMVHLSPTARMVNITRQLPKSLVFSKNTKTPDLRGFSWTYLFLFAWNYPIPAKLHHFYPSRIVFQQPRHQIFHAIKSAYCYSLTLMVSVVPLISSSMILLHVTHTSFSLKSATCVYISRRLFKFVWVRRFITAFGLVRTLVYFDCLILAFGIMFQERCNWTK